jgi:PhnB protein
MQFNTYLTFNGQCEAAFQFYEQTFGGKIEAMIPHAGTPAESHVPPEWCGKIMHARLQVGDSTLMGSDAPPGRYEPTKGVWVNATVKDPAEAERLFQALSENGSITMPLQKTFWATRFAMIVDRFGTPWMLNCE